MSNQSKFRAFYHSVTKECLSVIIFLQKGIFHLTFDPDIKNYENSGTKNSNSDFLFAFILGYSQVKVSGKVTYRNKGVGEVNVTLKNTYDGATTDAEGNFSFETNEKGNHILTFTHPKYETVEKALWLMIRRLL